MDIPINVQVICTDGVCGHSTYAIIDPATKQVTHMVVSDQGLPATEYLVPVDVISESTPAQIQLHLSRQEFSQLAKFTEYDYVPGTSPYLGYGPGQYMMPPYVPPQAVTVPQGQPNVPTGEIAVNRGAQVEATDGRVGRVDEFLIDPLSNKITHLVLRRGHLWGKREITIPVSQIERIEGDTVYLKLDKQAIEKLPSQPVRRESS